MYVCICNAVSELDVAAAAVGGARTIEAVGCATKAGTTCGTCQEHIAEIIERECGVCPMVLLRAG